MAKKTVKLKRYSGNPILKPVKNHSWERYVFNCAALLLDNKIHLVYRALGKDKVSRLGYASSKDGFKIEERLKKPIYLPKIKAESKIVKSKNTGVEDPRLTQIGNRIYLTYAASDGRTSQVALASIKIRDFLEKKWNWKRHGVLFPGRANKNAVLFPEKIKGRYVLYHRIEPNVWVSYSSDLKKWSAPKVVMRPRKKMWDSVKIGAGAPPIKLKNKWLFIYHGVGREPASAPLSRALAGRKEKYIYRLGYALIDAKNPEKILFRSKEPILEPVKDYEKRGQVPNVVFSCGAVIKGKKLLVYYGGADTVIGVASTDLDKLF